MLFNVRNAWSYTVPWPAVIAPAEAGDELCERARMRCRSLELELALGRGAGWLLNDCAFIAWA